MVRCAVSDSCRRKRPRTASRSTFSTLANESGKWSVNAIEAALAHIEPNAVRRAYARGDYWDERVNMMQWWGDYLDTLRQSGRVVPFMAARDRECKGGVGKNCREREVAVGERRRVLDSAMTSVEHAADPQSEAAIKLVAWISRSMMRPTPEDFAMLRLVLLALLPQIGGMLLLIGRRSQATVT
jgi:hypothetical protein